MSAMPSEPRRPTARVTRTVTPPIILLASLASVGCGDATGPAVPVSYDLEVVMDYMKVFSDCEDAAGNPGEWTWQSLVRVGPRGPSSNTGSSSYPSSSGNLEWADGGVYDLNQSVRLTNLSEAQRDSVTIRLTATEWDFGTNPPTADPDMNGRSQTNPLAFTSGPATSSVGLGGGRCALRLTYTATWTAN